MAPDRMLEMVGQRGGPLADAALWRLEVTDSSLLSPSFRRVVLTAPGIEALRHQPGQDLMLRVPLGPERVVNRRYSVRSFDPGRKTVTIDVSVHGAGPGTDWILAARTGERIDAIGPPGEDHGAARGRLAPVRGGRDGHSRGPGHARGAAPRVGGDRCPRGRHRRRRAGAHRAAVGSFRRPLAPPRWPVGSG